MTGNVVFGTVLTVSFLCLYFLPAIAAQIRHHHNAGAIFLVDLLLGWTLLGWIVALIWAFTNRPVPQVVIVKQSSEGK